MYGRCVAKTLKQNNHSTRCFRRYLFILGSQYAVATLICKSSSASSSESSECQTSAAGSEESGKDKGRYLWTGVSFQDFLRWSGLCPVTYCGGFSHLLLCVAGAGDNLIPSSAEIPKRARHLWTHRVVFFLSACAPPTPVFASINGSSINTLASCLSVREHPQSHRNLMPSRGCPVITSPPNSPQFTDKPASEPPPQIQR